MFIASNYSLVKGTSIGDNFKILSFDNALIDAKVGNYNILKVSSILPPNCCCLQNINNCYGSVLHMAYASCTGKGIGIMSSAVAVGIPTNAYDIGVIMEYSDFVPKEICLKTVEDLVKSAMKKRNISFNEIKSIGCEVELCKNSYSTTFAGIAMW